MSDQWDSAGVGATGGAAAGAGTGAVVGSVVPVVGTAAGAIIGGAVGAVAGGLTGYMQGAGKARAKAAERAAREAQARETARRANNVANIRALYGVDDPLASMQRRVTAQRMGAQLSQGINQNVEAAKAPATQQNLMGASTGLSNVNAAAAASGNQGSSTLRNKGAVMGAFLGGKQDIALGAAGNRRSADASLEQQRTALESSAAGGAQDISTPQMFRQQIGSMEQARSNIPGSIMGNSINMLANTAVQSSKMNALGYDTPDFFGGKSSGKQPGSRTT